MSEPHMDSPSDLPATLTFYDTAKMALAEAVRVDEAMKIRDWSQRIAFEARKAKDRDLMADAMEVQIRAEVRLGQLIVEAKRAGHIVEGRRKKAPTDGEPERVTLDEAGIDRKLSSKAQQLAERSPDEIEGVVKAAREKIKSGGAVVVNPIKDLNTQDKQLRRAIREHELAQRQKDLPAEIFALILEDPEWQFDTWSEAGKDRAADNHYPTSTLEALKARPVAALAAPDCLYALWATVPMLPQALELMAARGFDYKTHFIWDKLEAGTGYWNRNRHELLLIGVKGSVPAPAMGTQWESVIASPKGVHSAKPDWAYELLEHYFPNLKKIELNARRLRSGWTAWGYEAPEEDESLTNATTGNAATAGESARDNAATAGRESQVGSAGGRDSDPTSLDDVTGGESAASEGCPVAPATGPASEPALADPNSVAAAPETGGGASPTVPGAGEGADSEKQAPVTLPHPGSGPGQRLPHSGVPVDQLTAEQQDDIIRAGYATVPRVMVQELMALTGLTRDQIKKRVTRKLKIADPANQRDAARQLMGRINEARAGA